MKLISIAFVSLALLAVPAWAQSTSYPLTIQNGDRAVTFEKAPEKAVSLNGHTTEIMLTLGLAPRMVGTAYNDDPILPNLKADYDNIPMLSGGESYPSAEVVAGTGADFAFGRLSAFRDTTVATPERLKDLGITSYIVQGTLVKGTPESMEDVYADIENIGRIFDIQPKAAELIASMKQEIGTVTAKVASVGQPVKVLVYDSGDKTVYTAGKALETALIALAGGENVFADLSDTWADVNFEDVVARAPDVIVINDYSGDSADKKMADIKANPALATVPAVQNDRFVVLPLNDVFEGVRNPRAIATLASGFYPDLFK